MKIILFLVFLFLTYCFIGNLMSMGGNSFDFFIGVPGSGKTTLAAFFTRRRLKRAKRKKCSGTVLSNVPIKGAYKVQKSDIGHFEIKDCELLIDEAGLDYNNRNFKTFSDAETYFYKFHRHYNVDIKLFSQDFDVDVKLRKLCTRLFIVNKSFIPGFIKTQEIEKYIGINETTHQLEDQYRFKLFGLRLYYVPKLWKMFNTLDRKQLPTKEWEKY